MRPLPSFVASEGRQADLDHLSFPPARSSLPSSRLASHDAFLPLSTSFSFVLAVGNNSGSAVVPNGTVYGNQPQVVNTAFIALTDTDLYVTPYNLSLINNHTVAVGLYQAS